MFPAYSHPTRTQRPTANENLSLFDCYPTVAYLDRLAPATVRYSTPWLGIEENWKGSSQVDELVLGQ